MIKFFRKIRQNLLKENKTRKYLKYAIGEIVLVVIGIMIALSINNWNESLKQEAKIIGALKEIHSNLSEDIIEINSIIPNYRKEDSIINILIAKKLSANDFKGNQGFLNSLTACQYYGLNVNENGYKLLMKNSNNIPNKYQTIFKSLKNIYIKDKASLDLSLKFSNDQILKYLSHLEKNEEWYTDWTYNNKLTPKAIDFFSKDPYFKNHMTQYFLLSISNYYSDLHRFRVDAEESYQDLTKILQLEDVVALDSTYHSSINIKDYEYFLGTYKEDSTNSTAIISFESDELYYQWNNYEKVKLYPISKSTFITATKPVFNSIQIDSLGQVISHNWRFGNQQGTMNKIN
jgi:hypothetical protein